jgi:hypothetical protein
VAKYFEIPAAGVLLLATQVKELALCGMDSLVHYVPVTRANVFDKVKEVLDVPDKFVEIRDRGTKLVLETHSDLNRLDSFQGIFDKLWPEGHTLRRSNDD